MWNNVDPCYNKNMTGRYLSTGQRFFIVIATILNIISPCTPIISDKRLCYDPDCSVVIALAKTVTKYHSNDPHILSFQANEDAKIFSKGAGSRSDLWGVEIADKRGYAPSMFLREKRTYQKELKYEVPTPEYNPPAIQTSVNKQINDEIIFDQSNIVDGAIGSDVKPSVISSIDNTLNSIVDQVSPSFEIIDGTTFNFPPKDELQSDNSYSTKTFSGNTVIEQPISTFHPNLISSETILNQDTSADTVINPSEVSDQLAHQSVIQYLNVSEELPGESTLDHISQSSFNDQTVNFNKIESTISDEQLPVTEKNIETQMKNIQDEQISQVGNLEVINSNINQLPVDLTGNIVTAVDEKLSTVLPSENKIINDILQVLEPNESSTVTEEQSEQITDTINDSTPDIIAKAFDTVTSLFDGFSMTTDMPVVANDIVESIQETTTEPIQFNEDKITNININNEEVAVNNIANDAVTQDIDVVTSLYTGLPMTTEIPMVIPSSKENIQESMNFNADMIANANINNEEIAVNNFLSDIITQNIDPVTFLPDGFAMTTEMPMVIPSTQENIQESMNFNGDMISNTNINNEEIAVNNFANDIVTQNIDPITFLSDGFAMTTEMPMVTHSTKENILDSITESIQFNKDTIANTNINNEKVTVNNIPNDSVTQDVVHVDTAENAVDIVDNNISNETSDNIASVSEDHNSNVDTEILTPNSRPNIIIDHTSNFNEFPGNRNLLNVKDDSLENDVTIAVDDVAEISSTEIYSTTIADDKILPIDSVTISSIIPEEITVHPIISQSITNEPEDTITVDEKEEIISSDVCVDNTCNNYNKTEEIPEEIINVDEDLLQDDEDDDDDNDEMAITYTMENNQNYWETLSYVALTAFTTLLFSLGYYYMENTRRDGQLIAKINKLEKELLISSKECTVLDDSLKSTKTKLNSIEDQSFGSNEMVVSLKTDLQNAYKAKSELEDQVVGLEKDLEAATEAGLELERMLREILASNNAENPLAKSVEDLQTRLNIQQSANESLTTTLHLKTQENENLSSELSVTLHKCEQLEVEVTRINEELKLTNDEKLRVEQTLSQKIEQFENQIKNILAERVTLRKQLKGKEMEIKDLLEAVKGTNINGIDLEKLSDVSQVKAEASQLLEEKEELQIRLDELEGAHHLLEEHMKIINEEMKSLSKQCEIAEKEKHDAETRLQVLSKFFKEKEEERQKDEAMWLQQKGDVSTIAERLQTMNNEIQNYKQQIETLKREILDQEREYKKQITNLETKAHEQWVLARQSERRLEEAKAEAGQLRNRLTLVEKNFSDNESDVKTHRMDTNGETATSPQLFIGAEASSSPLMFTGSSNMPPPYLCGPPLPPFLPPPLHSSSSIPVGYDVGQRPPPLGGRLSSPPPIPVSQNVPPPPPPAHHPSSSGRFERGSSPPSPPLSPSMLPHYSHFRSHPPPPLPFPNDRIHPPPPVPLPSMLPGHLSNASWGDEKMSSRNNSSFHPFHREQHARDYKGSFVSSEESLDKTLHGGKS